MLSNLRGAGPRLALDHQMQMMLAATAERVDAVLCCSLTGRNRELLKAAAVAAQYMPQAAMNKPGEDDLEVESLVASRRYGRLV